MGQTAGFPSTQSRANSPLKAWRGHADVHRTGTERAPSVLHAHYYEPARGLRRAQPPAILAVDPPVGEAQLQPAPWALESPAGLHGPFQQLPRVKGPCIPVSAWVYMTQEQGGATGGADCHIPGVLSGIAPPHTLPLCPSSPKPVKLLLEKSDQTLACHTTSLFLMPQASGEAAWRALLFSIHDPKQRAPGASSQPLNCLEMLWGEANQFW